jgi:hypothetical protein
MLGPLSEQSSTGPNREDRGLGGASSRTKETINLYLGQVAKNLRHTFPMHKHPIPTARREESHTSGWVLTCELPKGRLR